MLIPTVPLILNIDTVLRIWLKDVPPYTNIFATLLLLVGLIRSMGAGFDAAIQASGKIRKNQIVYGCVYLSVLPLSFILYSLRFPVYTSILCLLLAASYILCFQANYLSKITDFDKKEYLLRTTRPCIIVFLMSIPLFILKKLWFSGFWGFISFSSLTIVWIMITIYLFGLSIKERTILCSIFNKYINKFKIQ